MRKKKAGGRKKNSGKEGRNSFYILMAVLIIFAVIAAAVKIYFLQPKMAPVQERVREPFVAGKFYPAQPGTLSIMVDSFLDSAECLDLGEVKAVVVPHAGYIYSGQTAAHAFRQLESRKQEIKNVFLIGSNHARGAVFQGVSVPNYTHYKTPLGKVKVSASADSIRKENPFTSNSIAHTSHIIEVELPFLQQMLQNDFEIIPMVASGLDQDMVNDAAKVINQNLDPSSLLVVSTDLSHYHPYDEAVRLDTACIQQIERQSFAGTAACEACGTEALLILLRISQMNGWKAMIIDYKNSGDTAGDKDSVVGYSAIVFYTEPEQFRAEVVDDEEQQLLLDLARDTVELYVREKKTPEVNKADLTDTLKEVRGCFVTLNKQGRLRGCIGHILPQRPLWECIVENAVNAATADSRFLPVTPDELDDIHIDISVLTLPQELAYDSPESLLAQLRPGVDGVVLRSGFRTSTYLPQVWDMFASKESFLQSLCRKQGSPDDCWKEAKISVYQAQVFEE